MYQRLAKTTLPFKPVYGLGKIDATVINPKNNKSAKVTIQIDTGSPVTALSNRFKRLLGVDKKDSYPSPDPLFDIYLLNLKIGTLKPMRTVIEIAKKDDPESDVNLLGYDTIKQFKRISATSSTITFEDNNPEVNDVNMLRILATYTSGIWTEAETDTYDIIRYFHPVTFFHKKTGKPVVIKMIVDTGTEYPMLATRYAKQLGIDDVEEGYIDSGKLYSLYDTFTYYTHPITIQLGKLKPISTRVVFGKDSESLLGLGDIIKKVRIDITGTGLKYTELVAAYVEAYNGLSSWRRRI